MRRVAWRSVRAHAKQFFLTTFAVMLGVAFLSGTLALRASLSETFSNLVSSTATSDLYVQGPKIASDNNSGGSGSSNSTQTKPIDGSLADQIKQIDGVEAAKPNAQMTGVLVGSNDAPVTTTGAPTLFVPLYDNEKGLTWVQGHKPQGAGEITLESGALKNSGLKVGDKTHIVVQGSPTEVTVVGEFHYESSMASATVVGVDPSWLMPIAAPDGKVTTIAVDVAQGSSVDTVKSEITKVIPDGAQVQTRAEVIKEQNKAIEEQLGFIQVFLLVFVVVAMFVGSFIIMNSFAMSVRQRVKEFALLRRAGSSSWSSVANTQLCPIRAPSPIQMPPWSWNLQSALTKTRAPKWTFSPASKTTGDRMVVVGSIGSPSNVPMRSRSVSSSRGWALMMRQARRTSTARSCMNAPRSFVAVICSPRAMRWRNSFTSMRAV